MRLLVIGGVAGGATAAAKAKRENKNLEVILLEEGPDISYGACGLPYYIAREIEEQSLRGFSPEEFQEKKGVEVRVHNRVEKIDREKKELIIRDLEKDEEYRESYDRLIFATGAEPFVPPLSGKELKGVYTLRTLQDGLKLAGKKDIKEAVIIGGGAIGCEMAEAYLKLGYKVKMVDKNETLLPIVDSDMGEIVAEHLQEKGAQLFLGQEVKALRGEDMVEEVELSDGKKITADSVLLALGVRPRTELAKEAGLKLGPRDSLWVDQYMRTSDPHIFGAGDCCMTPHILTGKEAWIPLGSTANKQGRVAGTNVAGGEDRFRGVMGTAQVKVYDLDVARTGLGEKEAKGENIEYFTGKIKAASNAGYYIDTGWLHLKLIVEKTGRILGAQAVGTKGVDKRIDVLACAIYNGMNVDELQDIDLGYAPPYSVPVDPVIVAGNIAAKKIKKST